MEVLDPKDIFGKTMGMKPEDLYNARLARGWSFGLAQELKFLQAFIRLAHPAMTARLRRYWRRTKPDMVVSLIRTSTGRCTPRWPPPGPPRRT